MPIDWGSVPDWLAGVGAALALVFAGIAARTTNKQVRQLEQQQRSSQASSVAVWVSTEKDDDNVAIVRYVNSSVLPVYSVVLCFHTPESPTEVARYPVLGPLSDRRTLRGASKALRGHLEGRPFAEWHERGLVLVAISFRDAAGQWWFRTADGELREAKGPDDAEAGTRRPPKARSMQHSGSTRPDSEP